jgi:hypothetical protein
MRRLDRRSVAFGALLGAGGLTVAPLTAIAEQPATVRYTVKSGDTLLGLTAQYLIGADAYAALVRSNNVPNPERIYPGSVLTVPVSLLRSSPLQAKVASFKGAVAIVSNGRAGPPTVGMAIREGDVLQTANDGFLTIILSNGSRMSMPTQSRVALLHMRQFLLTKSTDFDFKVDKGRTELSVTPTRDPNNLFRLRTPIAVSAVRGTQFRIGYDGMANPSLTEVIEGKVAVDGPSAVAATALVPAGYGAAAAASGAVGTEELLTAPVIADAARLWRKRFLDFNLVPVATARGYRLQLARDVDFHDMVAETLSVLPKLQLAGIDDGAYFARAMAVAPSGLEGLSQTYRINRQLSPLTASMVRVGGRSTFTWETDGRSSAPLFRFQLFSKFGNDVPVIDETGLTSYSMVVAGLATGDYTWRVGMRRVMDGVMTETWTDPEPLAVRSRER